MLSEFSKDGFERVPGVHRRHRNPPTLELTYMCSGSTCVHSPARTETCAFYTCMCTYTLMHICTCGHNIQAHTLSYTFTCAVTSTRALTGTVSHTSAHTFVNTHTHTQTYSSILNNTAFTGLYFHWLMSSLQTGTMVSYQNAWYTAGVQ